MRKWLVGVFVFLLGTLTLVPLPEMTLSAYFLAPGILTGIKVFLAAVAISATQMFYQYWGGGKIANLALAPAQTSQFNRWLERQKFFQVISSFSPPLLMLVAGAMPGIRVLGIGLWRKTGYRWSPFLLMLGTTLQLGVVFAIQLGAGVVVRKFFQ